MLEYAYSLESFVFLDGAFACADVADLFERLASRLARDVLTRARRGIHRSYLPHEGRTGGIRGRVEVAKAVSSSWLPDLPCRFEEYTADLEDNRILCWTLHTLLRHGIAGDRAGPQVRRALDALRGEVSLVHCRKELCQGRRYHRLNEDYRPLHALCRFFLENVGPSHELGDRTMLPFLVNMPLLFERFVAAWLAANLPPTLVVKRQERLTVGDAQGGIYFQADMVLRSADDDRPLAVLDTKHKIPRSPGTLDVAQAIAYAQVLGCREAILIYPRLLARPLDVDANGIRVRSLTFELDGELEAAGMAFLSALGLGCPVIPSAGKV